MAQNFDDWLSYGLKQGWISEVVCSTHEGLPMTDEEVEELEDWDACIPAIRIFPDNILYREANKKSD